MSIICTCGRASGPMCNGADGCPLNATDGMSAPKIKTWAERLEEERIKQQDLLAKTNTQLPAEVLKEIEEKTVLCADFLSNDETVKSDYLKGYKTGRVEGATEYATKLHQLKQDLSHAANNILPGLQKKIASIKAAGDDLARAARSLRLSVTAHPHYTGEENAEWTDLVEGIDEALAEWKGEKEPTKETTVFVPCLESDPRCSGGYTSSCGRSLCYVRESTVPVIEQGAVSRETIEDVLLKTEKFTTCECSEIADVILKDLPRQQGAIWVKAKDRLPITTDTSRLIIVRWQTIGGNQLIRYMAANQLADLVKCEFALNYEWLDEIAGEKEVKDEREK